METLMLKAFSVLGVQAFQTPEWFWGWLLLPVFWWLGWRAQSVDDWASFSHGQKLRVKHSMVDLHQPQKPEASTSKKILGWWFWQQFLRSLILLLAMTALAEPVKKFQSQLDLPQITQRDLVFVLESSASFLLPDYQQNGEQVTRMQAVKTVLQQFLQGLQGNRFGVVIYGEQAFSLLPLTSDLSAARISLQRLEPYLAGRTDEAMVEALGLALEQARSFSSRENLLEQQSNGDASSQVEKRAVILISDGLTAKSRYVLDEAINLAKQQNIPIYTIGVGAKNDEADKRQYQGLIYQPLESDSLQKLAQSTGGSYFHVGGSQALQEVLNKIDQLEGVKVPAPDVIQQYTSLQSKFILSALFLLMLYGFLIWLKRFLNRPVETQETSGV